MSHGAASHRRVHLGLVLSSGLALLAGLSATPVQAESQAAKRQGAAELVREALNHEVYGMDQQRQRLLARAAELDPDQPAAHWHRGEVRVGNRWLPATGLIESDNERKQRETYEQRRAAAQDTVDGQLALADWCARQHLTAQETAHLNRVIQLAPDHVTARQRLQFERVNGNWVRRQDLWQGLQQTQSAAESMRKWHRKLEELRGSLRRKVPALTQQMIERLKSELTTDAVPALEIVLGNHSEPAARIGVQLLGTLEHQDAAAALARQAVLSPWPNVREAAAEQLRSRPRDHFVPMLLAEMTTPIESRFNTVLVNGRLLYRHELTRETQDQRKTVVLDTVMDRRASAVGTAPGNNLILDPAAAQQGLGLAQAETRARALVDANFMAYARELERMRQNQFIEAMNDRICEALLVATGETLARSPEVWWSWWDKQNEVALGGSKPTDARYQQEYRTYQDVQPLNYSSPSTRSGSSPSPPRVECFVAGTPVWTITGPVSIEKIRIGDRVLSQHPSSGELVFQPVLQTSQRPPERLVKIRLATRYEDVLEGSGGHPLWVSGEGWVKLRDVKSGTVLHGVDGSTVVSDVEPGSTQPTFNLVVGEFHTYVVGETRILCHDNTPRRPTSAVVPGLVPR